MPKSILEVPGIGESTAKNLALHGIKSADELATATIDQLTVVKGFSNIRAAQIIQAAKDSLATTTGDSGKSRQTQADGSGKSGKSGKDKKEKKSKKVKTKSAKKKSDKKQSKPKKGRKKKSSGKKKKKK